MAWMRTVAAAICLLLVTGCAHDLPYAIAIGDPPAGQDAMKERLMGREECVLRLHDVVKDTAEKYRTSQTSQMTMRDLQIEFEGKLHHWTMDDDKDYGQDKQMSNCMDANGEVRLDQKRYPLLGGLGFDGGTKYPRLEEVSRKGLTFYSLNTANPDQDLNRLQEAVGSLEKIRQALKQHPLLPDESEGNLLEPRAMGQSEWCGARSGTQYFLAEDSFKGRVREQKEAPCIKARSLYHIETYPPDLYDRLLSEFDELKADATRRKDGFWVLGYEIPWDAHRTRVRYSVGFYFRESSSDKFNMMSGGPRPELIGYDLVYSNEATPAPPKEAYERRGRHWDSRWDVKLWRATGYPFSLVIGLKNAVFEIAKLPIKAIVGLSSNREAFSASLEPIQAAYDSVYVEVATPPSMGAEWGLYRLLTELPLVGPIFQSGFSSSHVVEDRGGLGYGDRRKVFLSRGIYGGNKWDQGTGLWTLLTKLSYPEYDVYSVPYRYGTVTDVVWSMLHLSHGPAYSEARYIMDHARRDDALYLMGHSGGVQRSVAASRILSAHGYYVVKVIGLAGPSLGQAWADYRYQGAFTVYLNSGSGVNQDIVSLIAGTATNLSTLFGFVSSAALRPVLSLLGGNYIYTQTDDSRYVTTLDVLTKPSSRHSTPMSLSLTDRVVYDAYIRDELSFKFREDLERPGIPHFSRPHAFPWRQ